MSNHRPNISSRLPSTAVAVLLLGILAFPAPVHAWFYPEHVVISELAWSRLPEWAREVINGAIQTGRDAGLELCDEPVDDPVVPFWEALHCARTSEADIGDCRVAVPDCIPYSALSSLAGDHSAATGMLEREVLTRLEDDELPVGQIINSFALELWIAALEDAGLREQLSEAGYFGDGLARQLNRYYGAFDRRALVRGLDVELFSLDPRYVETAIQAHATHFQLAGTPIDEVISGIFHGDLDNALAQFVVHHTHSVRLAKRGRETGSQQDIIDSLMHHAFALHYHQDAYASGHMVVPDDPFYEDSEYRKQRHDHFNRRGIEATYALTHLDCENFTYDTPVSVEDLTSWRACWTAYGDGHLGRDNSWQDLWHAAEGTARVQIQYAMTLDPTWLEETIGQCETGTFEADRDILFTAGRLDPNPPWVDHPYGELSPIEDRSCAVLQGAHVAVEQIRSDRLQRRLDDQNVTIEIEPLEPDVISQGEEELATALDPCEPRAGVPHGAIIDPDSTAICGENAVVVLGPPKISLFRAIMVAWPVATTDVRTLPGRDPFRVGLGYQLLAGPLLSARMARLSETDGADFWASTAGGIFSFGIAVIIDSVFPGPAVRPAVELNFGFTLGVDYGQWALQKQLFLEARWQIIWDFFMLKAGVRADWLNLLEGVRFYFVDAGDQVEYLGWDIEVYSYNFWSKEPERSATDPLPPPTSFRFRIGNQRANRDPVFPTGGITFSIELLTGYRSFF